MKQIFNEADFQKKILWLNGGLPVFLLGYDLIFDRLGANPPEALIRTTGVIAIIFLMLTLLVTPLSKLGHPWIMKHRRWLGLWSFYYALLHLLSYAFFDKALRVEEIYRDITKRPFILLGFLGFLILLPLALTSSNQMIKKLGPAKWRKLHQLTYLVPPLVVLHYWLIVKSDISYPLAFGVVFAALLLHRLTVRLWVKN